MNNNNRKCTMDCDQMLREIEDGLSVIGRTSLSMIRIALRSALLVQREIVLRLKELEKAK